MTYTNTPIVVSQQTTGYTSGNIPYSSIVLITGIPHAAQLEVERIFTQDRDGSTAPLLAFLADPAVTTAQKKAVFTIPISRCTLDSITSNITAVDLPATGGTVYNYVITTPTPTTYTIQIPSLSQHGSSTVTVRRKTVSNEPFVNWQAGSRLTSKQLNLSTTQSLYLIQEALEKIGTSVTIETTQITAASLSDNSVTTSAIASNAVTTGKIADGTIVNADINASAAIDGSKISPIFTSASTFSSTLGVTGNLAVNTNKFTVAASSGDTLAAGTFTATGGVTAASLTNKIQPITASVAASALTITLNPTILDFRSTTLTSGAITSIVVPAAISLTIPSTSTMGTVNAVQSRIVVLAINDGGTVKLAAVNIAGGSPLDETTLITTTAAVAAGNSATAYYSTAVATSVAYRVVGYIESTQATAGTWATAPSTIQGMGGQALTAMGSIGYGQTWQIVTGSRSTGTTYYNTTGKPIMWILTTNVSENTQQIINGINVGNSAVNGTSNRNSSTVIIPPFNTYLLSVGTAVTWAELR